jgi:hypothetical protein
MMKKYSVLTPADRQQAMYQGLLGLGAGLLKSSGPRVGAPVPLDLTGYMPAYQQSLSGAMGRNVAETEMGWKAQEQARQQEAADRAAALREQQQQWIAGGRQGPPPMDPSAAVQQYQAMAMKAAPGWVAPKQPVPGRDIPYAPEVASQLTDIAGAKAAAMRPSPQEVGEVERIKAETKAQIKLETAKPKALAALQGLERQTNTVVKHIDKALNLIGPFTTGYGSFLANLPETDARALKNELDTIRANVGFDKLQAMRDASPTGGALGQVSEMENRLLQAVNGALDPMQSEQLAANLQAIKELYPQVLAERKAAYEGDYGEARTTQEVDPFDAYYESLPSGATFTDPEGNQRIKP